MKQSLASLTALALTLGAAEAVTITYVDAVAAGMPGTVNTTGPTGTVNSASAWQIRGLQGGPAGDVNNFSNGGSAFQYNTNPIDASNPTLTTTITGLDPGLTYRAYVFFWDDGLIAGNPAAFTAATATTAWDVNAKLSSDGSYSSFNSTPTGSTFMVTTDTGMIGGFAASGYTNLTLSELVGENVLGQALDTYDDAYDGNRVLFAGALPTLITGVSSFSVDVQPGTFNTQRSWYDGIGFEVVPEPSATLLGGLALLGMLRRRR